MAFNPRKRDTFLIPSITADGLDKKHLHVALTDPVDPDNRIAQILLVGIASIRPDEPPGYDKTCVLKPGDHPFIKHDSYVVYGKAVIIELRDLYRNLANGTITPKEIMRADIFARVAAGVETSRMTQNHIVDFFCQALP